MSKPQPAESDAAEIQLLAEQLQQVILFAGLLIPHLDKLHEVAELSADHHSHVMSAAPIIMAAGGDYEAKEFETNVQKKRASALLNLVQVLKDTETERVEFKKSQKTKAASADQLRSMVLCSSGSSPGAGHVSCTGSHGNKRVVALARSGLIRYIWAHEIACRFCTERMARLTGVWSC